MIIDGGVGGERLAQYRPGMLADGADWGAQLDPFSSYAARHDCLDWLFHIDSEIPDDSQTLSTAIVDPCLARTHTDGRLSCDLTSVLPCRRHLSVVRFLGGVDALLRSFWWPSISDLWHD